MCPGDPVCMAPRDPHAPWNRICRPCSGGKSRNAIFETTEVTEQFQKGAAKSVPDLFWAVRLKKNLRCDKKRVEMSCWPSCWPSCFTRYLEPPEGFEGLTGDELYEAQAGSIRGSKKHVIFWTSLETRIVQVKYKTKMLGNIRLVGQLIRHGMPGPRLNSLELHVVQRQQSRLQTQ